MSTKKMAVGEAVIEFYASLDVIKEYYEKRGYRKMTLLHKALKEKLGWQMEYDTFRYHFNKEFKQAKKGDSIINKEESSSLNEPITEEKSKEPFIARPSFSKVSNFNPHIDDEE